MPDVKAAAGGALTRKIGPLPAWGWGIAVGGAALGVKFLTGNAGGGTKREVIEVPTGAPYPSDELSSQLGTALNELANRVDALTQTVNDNTDSGNTPGPSNPPPSTNQPGSQAPKPSISLPKGVDLGTYIIGLRERFNKKGPVSTPGNETAAQRQARLAQELAGFGAAGKSFDLGTYIMGIRRQYPKIAGLFKEVGKKGETAAERNARLRREVAHYVKHGVKSASAVNMTPTAGP